MSKPATHRATAVLSTRGGQAISARNTTQAADGARARAIPSQTCDSSVNRFA